jgi:hypothetical protein
MRLFATKRKAPQQINSAKATKPDWALSRQSRGVDSILHLQHTIGNQAVWRLLRTANR